MLKLFTKVTAVAHAMHAMGKAHGFSEFFGVEDPIPYFMPGDNFNRGVRYSIDPLDRVRRPESAARRSHGNSIDSIVALVPRIDRFVGCKCIHLHFPYEIVNQHYRPFNRRSCEWPTGPVWYQVHLQGKRDAARAVGKGHS